MLFNKIRFAILSTVIVLLAISFLLSIISSICPFELIANSIDAPVTLVRDNDFLCTGISQIVADDSNIYVLFGNYSVIQVYSIDGEYEYSIAVYNHMKGITSIATHNNRLYICDKQDNIYVYLNGEVIEFIDRSHSLSIRRSLPFGTSCSNYKVRSASIWYTPNGELLECVIQRPTWLSIYQNNLLFIFQFALIVLAGVVLFYLPKPNV